MSVKLPLIIKREPQPSNSKKQQPIEHQERIPQHALEQEEPDYNDQFEEQPEKENQQPIQTITVLKKQQKPKESQLHVQLHTQSLHAPKVNYSKARIQDLRKTLQQKILLANSIKENVGERKRQIKNISQQIDKDLNKTLLKSKHNSVNIRDIFSAPPKSNNKVVNELNQQLRGVRATIKKTKMQIQKLSNSFMDPIHQLNQEKGSEFENRLKTADEEIRYIEKEKELLSEQIGRSGIQFSEEQEKAKSDQINKLNISLLQIIASQKQYKTSTYQLQKEDILLMEKIKFLQEKEGLVAPGKKPRSSLNEGARLQEQIRQLIVQVNEIMEERNRVEGEKKAAIKNLNSQIGPLETKNWGLCSKLRQIDSFLLQYYDRKSKKKEIKLAPSQNNSEIATMQKSVSGKIESQSLHLDEASKTIEYENDKNKKGSAEAVFIEKKKAYEFVAKESLQGQINLSDEFLGNKLNISSLTLTVDDSQIYAFQAIYQISPGQFIAGYCMGSKQFPQNCRKIEMKLDRQRLEIINFIHVGFDQAHSITFFHLASTEGKQMKWGSPDQTATVLQKHIKKYQFCNFKSKVMPHRHQSEYLCMSGLAFSTIYLGAK